jgi:sigma-B regulation protein RsbU (phosphoserine phosphatase)
VATYPRPATTTRPVLARPFPPTEIENLIKLQKAAQEISSILDLDQLIDRIVNDISRWFGCVESSIYLRAETSDEMIMAAVHGCSLHGKGHRLKAGHGMVGHVVQTGEMHYAPDVSLDPYYAACEPSTRSEVVIPLKAGGRVIGAFTTSHHELDAFPLAQLQLLQALTGHIAVAVQNAYLFRKERLAGDGMRREAQEARQIQQALFPKSSPFVPGFVIAGKSVPASAVGGDWYDYIPLSDGRWGLVLADVSGKGMAAALLMSATRGILRSLAEASSGPGEVLTRINRLLLEDFPCGRFVTMVYAVFDPAKRALTIANAGHPWPILADIDGARPILGEQGLPIGLCTLPSGSSQPAFTETTVHLAPQARVLLYSDGISEAENELGEEFGRLRLQTILQSPEVSVENLLEHVGTFAGARGLQDDATAILIEGLKN